MTLSNDAHFIPIRYFQNESAVLKGKTTCRHAAIFVPGINIYKNSGQ
jgi:hypothetical protein